MFHNVLRMYFLTSISSDTHTQSYAERIWVIIDLNMFYISSFDILFEYPECDSYSIAYQNDCDI